VKSSLNLLTGPVMRTKDNGHGLRELNTVAIVTSNLFFFRLKMRLTLQHFLLTAVSSILPSLVVGLGSSCSAPLGPGNSSPGDPFWMQSIKHQGISAYNSNPGYQVFRNVKDFGAKGDGVTDDTHAFNAAISSGGRCGGGSCQSSTRTPAVVFVPKGYLHLTFFAQCKLGLITVIRNYVISAPIILFYYTELIGDAKYPPTLLASGNFQGIAVIDTDPYIPGGNGQQWYTNQNNFFRSVRNFVIDVRQIPPERSGTGLHWQVAQATSLMNILFFMSTASNTAHQGNALELERHDLSLTYVYACSGIWMENGSGGFMGDLVFNGVRNVTFNDAQTAVYSIWNWGWTFQGININNCKVGFDLLTGGITSMTQTVGAIAVIDAVVRNTPTFIHTSTSSYNQLAGSLVINNAQLYNVQTAVAAADGATVLPGGTKTISSWAQGNIFKGSNSDSTFVQGDIYNPSKPSSLLDGSGKIFGKAHPQYASYAVNEFVSVKDYGAKGDGRTDDTAALQTVFDKFYGCKIIFIDAGTYIVTSTLTIPAGSRVVGEAWSVIAGSGAHFQDATNPQAVVRVGEPSSQGVLEITDIIFSTVGPTPGAIVVEWNVEQPAGLQGGAGTWDTHIRLGGVAGTNLETEQCPNSGLGGSDNCYAAFLALHLKPTATAYLEARDFFCCRGPHSCSYTGPMGVGRRS
ncbi:hypothetical protein H0H93_014091, partial [Arthromyces matolae]